MLRTKIVALSSVSQELTYPDAIDTPNSISIQNLSDTKFGYIGNENVSLSSYGFRLDPGTVFTIDLLPPDRIYAVGESGCSVAVFVIEK